MPGPLEGTKVVEMGLWVAGPSAAAMLGDWGASVVKIEPPAGDPFRGLFASVMGNPAALNPPFELDNRGKRSVVLNLENAEAREVAYRLIADADVFITNNRPRVLEEFGMSYDELSKRFPGLVYGQVTGYGPHTGARDTAAYDVGAFWSQAGVGGSLTAPGGEIPQQRGGMGDHMTGMSLAGAICAALLSRERTGKGQHVSVPLVRVGAYMIGWDLMLCLRLGIPVVTYDRYHAVNPIIDCYKASDGRWFWLLLLQADRHWGDLCRAIGREDLMTDERFMDILQRRINAPALVEELDKTFGTKPLTEWTELFKQHNVWFAPVNWPHEVINDPVVQDAGAFIDVPTTFAHPEVSKGEASRVGAHHGDGGGEGSAAPGGGDAGTPETIRMVATPADFSATRWAPQGPPPELGQHTEELLLELGYDWDGIIALKEAGAIP